MPMILVTSFGGQTFFELDQYEQAKQYYLAQLTEMEKDHKALDSLSLEIIVNYNGIEQDSIHLFQIDDIENELEEIEHEEELKKQRRIAKHRMELIQGKLSEAMEEVEEHSKKRQRS